jgi:hypothetical protein
MMREHDQTDPGRIRHRRVAEPANGHDFRGTPDHESHDRFPLPRPLSRKWRGEIRESLTRLSH